MKLAIGESHVLKINPAIKWQDTEVDISANEVYEFAASGFWVDFYIITTADGYRGNLLESQASKKRAPEFNWLALMGSLDQNDSEYFLIGKELRKTFTDSGRLSCFANDMKTGAFYLKNNWGKLTLSITRRS